MFGESWDVFKNLVLVEERISDIFCENPGGSPLCQRPCWKLINLGLGIPFFSQTSAAAK